jgi:hypothetical protein
LTNFCSLSQHFMLMFQRQIDFVVSSRLLIPWTLYRNLSLNLDSFPTTFWRFVASFEIWPWTWLGFLRYFCQIVLNFMEVQDCPF